MLVCSYGLYITCQKKIHIIMDGEQEGGNVVIKLSFIIFINLYFIICFVVF